MTAPVDQPFKTPYRIGRFSLSDADRWGEQLEALLKRFGLPIDRGSELERICLAPAEILSYRPGTGISSSETYRQYLDTAALGELATRLLAVQGHPCFETLVPHLQLLNQGDPRQVGRARDTDQAARKVFELFVAVLAMQFSRSVELEHPLHGSPNNPDVVVEYQGKRWGLACKVPTSDSRESLAQNVERAAQQVVASGVDAGFPLFNLKNVNPPEAYWCADPQDKTGQSFFLLPEPPVLLARALSDVTALWREVEEHVGAEVFAALLSPRPCVPAVLSYFHALAPVSHDSFIAITTARFVTCYHIHRHAEEDTALVDALHASATAGWPGE